MAFIELKHKDGYPILLNVNQIESVKPSSMRSSHSNTLIIYQNGNYNVRESYVDVVNLINKTTTVDWLNLEKRARTSDG